MELLWLVALSIKFYIPYKVVCRITLGKVQILMFSSKQASAQSIKHFNLGVNYWPAEYGLQLWKKWDQSVVDRDFARIAAMGCSLVRIFLVWEDFQPLREYRGVMDEQVIVTYLGDNPLGKGNPSVDMSQVAKFDEMLALAEKHELQLIPTFFTGWMSGVLLDVQWRDGRNIFSDPYMLHRQTEFVSYFAERYADDGRIYAWDLGNEQNCFMECHSRHDAWLWTWLLTGAIKAHDILHPVTSGMCLDLNEGIFSKFLAEDMAEILDFICTHPYPRFRLMCIDKLDNLRTTYLPTFEHCLQRDISGRPVLCEEFAGLCCSRISQDVEKRYIRTVLHSLLANGSMGALYWCYSDFITNTELPYAAIPIEKHLGLVDTDGTPGPVAGEITAFSKLLAHVDMESWQLAACESAIMVPHGLKDYSALYNSFILSRMAGFDLKFVTPDEDYSVCKLIILPSFYSSRALTLPEWEKLKDFVRNGGVLYMSYKNFAVKDMDNVFGISILGDEMPGKGLRIFRFAEEIGACDLSYAVNGSAIMLVQTESAKVLSANASGEPNIVINSYGNGRAILSTEPLEEYVAAMPCDLPGEGAHTFYRYLADLAGVTRAIKSDSPFIEHKRFRYDGGTVDYLINHGNLRQNCVLDVSGADIRILAIHGDIDVKTLDDRCTQVSLTANGAVLFEKPNEGGRK
jgi:beta-galactosidase